MTTRSRNGDAPRRLVIVESPTKAKTIRRFLPRTGYTIEASLGHVRDLPASAAEIPAAHKGKEWARLGVKTDEGFEPLYVVPSKKKKVVSQLKAALKQADELYIATDEDREGESIGWHLVEVLKPTIPVKRMVFHEITEEAIRNALEHTRDIDRSLVDAQETRRILDRLVGYTISPLLWKKIAPKLSAGRVQSVAVRLLVLREKERLAFVPATYWDLKASVVAGAPFGAVMTELNDVRLATGRDFEDETGRLKEGLEAGRDVLLLEESRARSLARDLKNVPWHVAKVEERTAKRSPSPPFTTSTLQQESSRKLGLSAKDTMRTAQSLYENGYITYMRTDSTNLSGEAVDAARRAVERRYGREYLFERARQYATKSKNAQEAHEAIRPAGTEMKTADEHGLTGVEARLYDLIWKRTIATQMAEAQLKFVTATLAASAGNDTARFRATGRTTIFPGFFRAYVEGSDDPDAALDDQEQPLPPLVEGQRVDCRELDAAGHETKPPARYTEASLVKLLESEGIGRPSTYASIIDTIINRGYVRKNGSALTPTFMAFATNNLLERQFDRLVDTGFTAQMEGVLDDIAAGAVDARPYLKEFYGGSHGITIQTKTALEEVDAREVSTLDFEQWAPYIVRVGRFGPYVETTRDGERVTASLPHDLAPADTTRETLEEILRLAATGDNGLGRHPETDESVFLRTGPYGPYVQLGEGGDGKPKRTSVPQGVKIDDVTLEYALKLLSLPRALGEHPDTGKPIEANLGRFGPYVKHGSVFASIPKGEDMFDIELERAVELIRKKEGKSKALRVIGNHPVSDEPIEVFEGRYGPYVKHRKTNATIPKGTEPDGVTLEQAVALLAEKGDTGEAPAGKGSKAKPRKTSAKATAKKASANGTNGAGAKRSGAKRSTTKSGAGKTAGAKRSVRAADEDRAG